MKKGTSKNKGSAFERFLGRELSLWWTNGEDRNIFMRSASSGAWNTMHRNEGVSAHAGDIEAADRKGKLFTDKVMVEAKWYKSEQSLLFEVLLSKRSQILEWWTKCELEATDMRKIPLLVVKFNYQIPFIVLPNYFYSEIYKTYGDPPIKSHLMAELNFDDTVYKYIVIMRFDNFLNWCKPELFKGGK